MRGMPIELTSLDDFLSFARTLGARLEAGDVIALSGALGAGKTTFVRGLVAGRNGSDPVSSPTFTFWHHYPGEVPFEHLDLYRIDSQDELRELGLEEAFSPHSVAVVEWPDRAAVLLPPDVLRVAIAGSGAGPRRIDLSASGPRSARLLE